jgi:carbonic anhydrase
MYIVDVVFYICNGETVMNSRTGFIGSMNRRSLLKLGGTTLAAAALGNLWQPAANAAASSLSPDDVLRQLLDGNARFIAETPTHPHNSAKRRTSLAQAQNPIATILSCADSRVPAELLFDVGLGDLFNVRVAGNVINPEVIGSLEYAVELLNTPLLMILGHERCGAVTAAVKHQSVPGSIGTFIHDIEPAIALAHLTDQDSDAVAINKVVSSNVQYQMEQLLEQSRLIADRVDRGSLKIIGSRYDLDSGAVTSIIT